ncbi:MAG TPA: histidine kinase, partial [Flavobacterium sp.]|nr:histidine kinase [Flavobacterium sp.]
MSRIILPKFIQTKNIKPFIIKGIVASAALAVALSCFAATFFPDDFQDDLQINIHPFVYNLISTLPAVLVMMIGFCGLEFFRQHLIQEKIHAEEKFRFLQNQMNPHIMFNVLNHIHILMHKNVETASQLLTQFSDILRYQLYECNSSEVFLDKEINYLKEIIAIEQMRWGEFIKVTFSVEVEHMAKKIAPFILITFIENAFKHVSRNHENKGFVKIRIKEATGKL